MFMVLLAELYTQQSSKILKMLMLPYPILIYHGVLVGYNNQYKFSGYKIIYTEEKPEEGNTEDDDDLNAGAIFGIVLVCIAGHLVLILIIVAIVVALHRKRKDDKTDG